MGMGGAWLDVWFCCFEFYNLVVVEKVEGGHALKQVECFGLEFSLSAFLTPSF